MSPNPSQVIDALNEVFESFWPFLGLIILIWLAFIVIRLVAAVSHAEGAIDFHDARGEAQRVEAERVYRSQAPRPSDYVQCYYCGSACEPELLRCPYCGGSLRRS